MNNFAERPLEDHAAQGIWTICLDLEAVVHRQVVGCVSDDSTEVRFSVGLDGGGEAYAAVPMGAIAGAADAEQWHRIAAAVSPHLVEMWRAGQGRWN